MNRKQVKKRAYMKPTCKIIQMQTESFICTSVTPSATGSSTSQWGSTGGMWASEEQHSGGTTYVGGSEVAP